MSGATGLDIRMPIGGLFSGLGLLLTGYGAATAGQHERYVVSAGVNINLWWGMVMLAFGVILLLVASRSRRESVRPAVETTEGSATEARERARGLEH
jgi:hypothetical protein